MQLNVGREGAGRPGLGAKETSEQKGNDSRSAAQGDAEHDERGGYSVDEREPQNPVERCDDNECNGGDRRSERPGLPVPRCQQTSNEHAERQHDDDSP
jgi:hypothetical protein